MHRPLSTPRFLPLAALGFLALVRCGGGGSAQSSAPDGSAGAGGGGTGGAGGGGGDTGGGGAAGDGGGTDVDGGDPGDSGAICSQTISPKAPFVVTAAGGESVLELDAHSAARTSWGTAGNEAIVLAVTAGARKIGHLVLHQGIAPFHYKMHLGSLSPNAPVTLALSDLSAANAIRSVCVSKAAIVPASSYGAMEPGIVNAPIYVRPKSKSFDDLPVAVGYSKSSTDYVTVYTNENGGTTKQCGGGASGLQSEIARWGRGADIENQYNVKAQTWERCTGSQNVAPGSPRFEDKHPILYYGNGHNVVFESRGGYGNACGSGGPEKADGDIEGWSIHNPGDDPANDDPYVIVIRPVPEDLDAIGGHRESLLDRTSPWVYRLTALEVGREGKIDNSKTFGLEQYIYMDVWASDVDGTGDSYCSLLVKQGFKVRAETALGEFSGPEMTKDYFGGQPGVKRYALELPQVVPVSSISALKFDAYDGDGIYLQALGDAFIARPDGDNGATLDYVFKKKDTNVYVDDNNSGCVNGANPNGPGGKSFPCAGGDYTVLK